MNETQFMKYFLLVIFSFVMLVYGQNKKERIIQVFFEDSNLIENEITEYSWLNVKKKNGLKYYIDTAKLLDLRNRKSSQLHNLMDGNEKHQHRFEYLNFGIKFKECSAFSDYGDTGVVKFFRNDGTVESMGVAYYLRKVGAWYYYNTSNDIYKVEYHQCTSENSKEKFIFNVIGTSIFYPKLVLLVPEDVMIEYVNY